MYLWMHGYFYLVSAGSKSCLDYAVIEVLKSLGDYLMAACDCL